MRSAANHQRPVRIALAAKLSAALLLAGVVLADTSVTSRPAAASTASSPSLVRKPVAGPFVVRKGAGVLRECLMYCPAHRHGTPKQALELLKERLRRHSSDNVASIAVCRANQLPTLRMFSPFADQVFINPFCNDSKQGPGKRTLYWPGCSHPLVNQLRRLQRGAHGKRLLAYVDLAGERHLFQHRRPALEEVEWMVYALIGSGFQGIVWRHHSDGESLLPRLQNLERGLLSHAEQLGASAPVNWATGETNQPVSARASANYLFVTLIDPDYMKFSPGGKEVVLPVSPKWRAGTLEISLPPGVAIKSGRTIAGMELSLTAAGAAVKTPYRFKGGGELMIFALTRDASHQEQQATEN